VKLLMGLYLLVGGRGDEVMTAALALDDDALL
jgi:hypothetical protein